MRSHALISFLHDLDWKQSLTCSRLLLSYLDGTIAPSGLYTLDSTVCDTQNRQTEASVSSILPLILLYILFVSIHLPCMQGRKAFC